MAERDFDWFLQNEKAFESLTTEQVHILGQGGTVEYGETVIPAADPAPATVAAAVEPAKGVEESVVTPTDTSVKPENDPVVLTADGKHTIPYAEHVAARQRAQVAEAGLAEANARVAEQAELIESLKAAKTADAGTGNTAAQDEVLNTFKAAYPELAETLTPVLDKLMAAKEADYAAKIAAVEAKLADTLAPIQTSALDTAIDKHLATIRKDVPDFDSLLESGAVDKWVASLPSYAKLGAERVLEAGTATEVVELFTQYKAANASGAPALVTPSKADADAAAALAIKNARSKPPTSLSDVPTQGVNTGDTEPTTVADWSRKFAKMDPDAIMRSL